MSLDNSAEKSNNTNAIQKAVKPAGNYSLIQKFVDDPDIDKLSIKIDKAKGILKISGKKGDEAFNSTRELYSDFGEVQSASKFDTENMIPEDRAEIVRRLRQKGRTQQEIGAILGISQSLVSNILRKGRNS